MASMMKKVIFYANLDQSEGKIHRLVHHWRIFQGSWCLNKWSLQKIQPQSNFLSHRCRTQQLTRSLSLNKKSTKIQDQFTNPFSTLNPELRLMNQKKSESNIFWDKSKKSHSTHCRATSNKKSKLYSDLRAKLEKSYSTWKTSEKVNYLQTIKSCSCSK